MKNFKQHFITVILSCYAILLFYLLVTGTIRSYINQKLLFLSEIAFIIICAMIFSNLKKTFGKSGHSSACHCCHHEESGKIKPSNFLLFLPIILSIAIAPGTFADSQRMSTKYIPAGYQEYTQLDISDATLYVEKAPQQRLTHTKIFLRGKVSKSYLLKENEIIVYRVMFICCAADGIPMGIVVKLPENTNFQNDDWVGIEGTIQLLPFDKKFKNIDLISATVPPEKIYPYFTATKAYKIQPAPPGNNGYADPVSVNLIWQFLASALLGILCFSKRIRYWIQHNIFKSIKKSDQ